MWTWHIQGTINAILGHRCVFQNFKCWKLSTQFLTILRVWPIKIQVNCPPQGITAWENFSLPQEKGEFCSHSLLCSMFFFFFFFCLLKQKAPVRYRAIHLRHLCPQDCEKFPSVSFLFHSSAMQQHKML